MQKCLKKSLKKLKKKNSSGCDGLSQVQLVEDMDTLISPVLKMYNLSIEKGEFPVIPMRYNFHVFYNRLWWPSSLNFRASAKFKQTLTRRPGYESLLGILKTAIIELKWHKQLPGLAPFTEGNEICHTNFTSTQLILLYYY